MQVVATEHSTHFFDENSLPVKVHRDKDEWDSWKKMQDPVLHIEVNLQQHKVIIKYTQYFNCATRRPVKLAYECAVIFGWEFM